MFFSLGSWFIQIYEGRSRRVDSQTFINENNIFVTLLIWLVIAFSMFLTKLTNMSMGAGDRVKNRKSFDGLLSAEVQPYLSI